MLDTTEQVSGEKGLEPPALSYQGGMKAITLDPVIGVPERLYPEVFVPGCHTAGECAGPVAAYSGTPVPELHADPGTAARVVGRGAYPDRLKIIQKRQPSEEL